MPNSNMFIFDFLIRKSYQNVTYATKRNETDECYIIYYITSLSFSLLPSTEIVFYVQVSALTPALSFSFQQSRHDF
jgi:hypothetical protein